MYNSDLNRAVDRFWLSYAPSASVGRQVLAKLERLIRTSLHEIGERRVTLFNWTLDVMSAFCSNYRSKPVHNVALWHGRLYPAKIVVFRALA